MHRTAISLIRLYVWFTAIDRGYSYWILDTSRTLLVLP